LLFKEKYYLLHICIIMIMPYQACILKNIKETKKNKAIQDLKNIPGSRFRIGDWKPCVP